MEVIIGSARSDENGRLTNGKAGDQNGREVSTQKFYHHSKGWDVIRAKDKDNANKIASAMKRACDNNHIGYDQNNRTNILKYGTSTTVDTECDCSSLVRMCVIEATGKDPGNFTTYNEKTVLLKTGLFEYMGIYRTWFVLNAGDILVTCVKGHTVVVCSVSDNLPTLKKGMRSEAVKTLQGLLNKNGAHLSVDGDFGQLTLIALIEFQGSKGLSKDGICGPKTWKALQN